MVIFQISVPYLHIQTQLYEGINWLQANEAAYPCFQRQRMLFVQWNTARPPPQLKKKQKQKTKELKNKQTKRTVVNNVSHWLSIWMVTEGKTESSKGRKESGVGEKERRGRVMKREISNFKQKITHLLLLSEVLLPHNKNLTEWHLGQLSQTYEFVIKFYFC